MTNAAQHIIARDQEFLEFLHARYPLFHASNVFFRDLHYGVMTYLEQHRQTQGYVEAEATTREVIAHYERAGILRPLNERTWLLMLEAFRPKPSKPAPAPAKPAAPASAPAAAPAS